LEGRLDAIEFYEALACFCQRGLLPLVGAVDTVPHLSGIVSIFGGGDVLKPIVIFKNPQNVGDLSDMELHCLFATSQNGWIIKDLWIYYALVFSAQMREYRLNLPQAIREEEILLVIDTDTCRLSFLAAMIVSELD
jgi:hypothetical protein